MGSQGELTLTQKVRAEGNDSLGARGAQVSLIKPNQIKPIWRCLVAEAPPNWRVALSAPWQSV